jgi:hypothetical protein
MRLVVCVLLISACCHAQTIPPLEGQRFVCDQGYRQEQCDREMGVLRPMLIAYHADWVGDWTWVLVPSEKWRTLMLKIGANPDSPALTVLSKRETFFSEALFELKVGSRAELLRVWQMPVDKLAELAVAHEIGHAMCADMSEVRADERAQLLLLGKLPSCGENVHRATAH